ncbi:hypothetical protein GCM10009665_44730 [Kitasatospora nipponensis]|uniref:DUF4190 domain-containing protein n=1 Tax=Kitasatospora nipponensis TaxID=258049 RepID=A0ABN1WFM4_9ACTN
MLAVVPLGLVFGVIGLVQVRRSGQRGKAAAVTGLVAATVWALLFLNLADMFTPAVQRDAAGGVSQTQVSSVFALRAGDCFTVRSRTDDGGIEWVALVPCGQAHEGRVYATPALPYRADVPAETAARAACDQALPGDTPADATVSFLYSDALEYSAGHGKASCFTRP